MAHLLPLAAGLLMFAGAEASDVADRSMHQGFLSKSDYDKFITPNLNRMKHGNELGASPFTVVDDKPILQSSTQVQNSSDPISLSIFGIGLVSFVTMLGLSLWRALQPATIPNTVSASRGSGDNSMEMQSQDSDINTRKVGWGQLSSENSRQQTLCYGRKDWSYPANELSTAKSAAMPFLPCPPALDGTLPGDRGFDPLGFTNLDWNMAEVIIPKAAIMAGDTELPMIYWLREAELKHGRITMLAIVGYLTVDAGIHFPGAKYEGIDALHAHDAMIATGNMGVMLLFAAVAELTSMTAVIGATKGSGREAGDFSLDPLEFCGNPETKAFMKEAEITHARLAMLAFSGLVTQSALLEKGFPYF